MSYLLADSNGPVGYLASNTGLSEMHVFLRANGGPALRQLVSAGWARTEELQTEIPEILKREMPDDIRTTIENLQRLVSKADEIAIVTQ